MMNQKGFTVLGIATGIVLVISISVVGWRIYRGQSPDKAPEVSQVTDETREAAECVSKPIAGTVIFDVVQPAPFIDPRVNEIEKDINASRLTWRDGRIIKIDGKDHSSGKYFAKVEKGSEESAVAILKNNPSVTFAAQDTSFCPVRTKVRVE